MSRTLVAAQAPLGSFPTLPVSAGTATLAEQAWDNLNGNYGLITTGKTYLLCHNTNVGAQTVTITSVKDPQNRTGDITTYSIAAGAIAVFGPFVTSPVGWAQATPASSFYFDASDVSVQFIVFNAA
jgi:hypothetical protein